MDLFDNWDAIKSKGVFNVTVTPKASSNRIKQDHKPDGSTEIRVYVTTAPEDGKANKAVIDLLAEALDIPKSSLIITHGLSTRRKTVKINNIK